jgi:hypothetical protein
MEEDEFVAAFVREVLPGHREGEFVGIAIEIVDHVPLDVAIDRDLGDGRRQVGARRDRDGEAVIIIDVAPVPCHARRHEVHLRTPFEGHEACR